MSDRLELLYVSPMPPSPPRFGAQVRMHGLMTALARTHAVTAVTLVRPDDDRDEVGRALRAYCREVVLVPLGGAGAGTGKRLLQVRSLVSRHSYERLLFTVPALQRALDRLLAARRFDVVNLEFPFLAHHRLRGAPPGASPPALVLDEHNVEYDTLRQVSRGDTSLDRRVYNAVNWRKLRAEEEAAWRDADGITLCSAQDARAVHAALPGARTAVVPNAVDVDAFRPAPGGGVVGEDPIVLFFGALNYFPNVDGILWFLEHTWPLLAARHPRARLKIVGPRPPPEVLARRSPRVEVTGFVEDLRPHLAGAAVIVAPLRFGGGTRLKIVEAMAMARPVVSTTLGAEGLEVAHGSELLLADDPAALAAAVTRVLEEPGLAGALASAARRFVERHHSWTAAAATLESFFRALCERDRVPCPGGTRDGRAVART